MKPSFLDCPARHTTAQRQDQSPADYACPVVHTSAQSGASVVLAIVIGILLAAALVHWWAS